MEVFPALKSFGQYLATDQTVLGVVGWVSLVVTVGGFAVAIDQIRRTKTAAQAANNAAQAMSKAVFGRERLLDLSTVVAHLNSAKDRITQGRYEAALVFIDFAISECTRVHALMNEADKRKFYKLMSRLRKLGGDLHGQGDNVDASTSLDLALDARGIVEALNETAAGLRYSYNLEGPQE